MPRVNLEDHFFSDPRADRMARILRKVGFDPMDLFKPAAKGLLADLWHESQAEMLTHATKKKIEEWTLPGMCEVLEEAGYIEKDGELYRIIGNDHQIASLQQRSVRARAAAKKRWDAPPPVNGHSTNAHTENAASMPQACSEDAPSMPQACSQDATSMLDDARRMLKHAQVQEQGQNQKKEEKRKDPFPPVREPEVLEEENWGDLPEIKKPHSQDQEAIETSQGVSLVPTTTKLAPAARKTRKTGYRFEQPHLALAIQWKTHAKEISPSLASADTEEWADAIRRACEKTGRTPEQFSRIAEWIWRNDFWSANCISPLSLFKKKDGATKIEKILANIKNDKKEMQRIKDEEYDRLGVKAAF